MIHIDSQDFSGDGWLVSPRIRVASGKAFEFDPEFAEIDEPSRLKSVRDHRRSQALVRQPPVLIILCIDVVSPLYDPHGKLAGGEP